MTGTLKKMRAELGDPQADKAVQYYLPIGEQEIHLTPLIGKPFAFSYTGNIYCSSCGKKTKKSYSQGHCFVCMKKLASCDMCIMKPETCHFAQGTCREPQWAEQFCMTDHFIYLSNTSGLKVGITRHSQIPTRWIDQGAKQALAILRVKNRLLSGLVEVELAKLVADKTNWRALLKGEADDLDLVAQAEVLLPQIEAHLAALALQYGEDAISRVELPLQEIHFPVTEYPTKISSFNLDKVPEVSGVLQGIKGQYLIFDTGVINMRKYGSYELSVDLA
ncbi:DUF2797 domain-containing protein [Motilimonas cestriensis]|uniref:DUF2797 domain-containing protein n=1 Tax=Motilimonas cestriensis TaxID=2742685 RepID=UPI003DA5038B